jgi:ABC-type oligopeptide transport system substrate-binding subunit
MRRRLLAWLTGLALSGALLAPTAAFAAQTETIHVSDSDSFAHVNPCSGATGTLTVAFSGVLHITTLDNGTVHVTETLTTTATFVPNDPSQPTYTGHYAESDSFNTNANNVTGTVAFNAIAHGSDGSLIKMHVLYHRTVNAIGTVTSSIETEKLTCL